MKEEIILTNALPGRSFKVKRLGLNMQHRRHLCALGLTLGTEIELKKREMCGSCFLIVRGSYLVLDAESARNIVCEPVFPCAS